ncbi:MAG: Gfo/Idh/MocA family protein, partial [Candidatus Binatia bacterium]
LQVGHLERFNPVFKDIRRVIGRPRFMECHRLAPFAGRGSDTDVVFDVMIHDLDLIDYLVGASLERVEAVGVPVLSDKIDIANARLIFDGGCTANVTASRVSLKRERKMRVFQEDAYVSIDFDSGKALVARKSRRRGAAEVGNPMDAIEAEEKELGGGDPLMEQLAAFVSCVRGGSRPLIGGPEGLRALALADRVVKAIPDFGPGG